MMANKGPDQILDENALKKKRLELQKSQVTLHATGTKLRSTESLKLERETVACKHINPDICNYSTLRQCLGNRKTMVGQFKCLSVFKQILEHVSAAHSQGIVLKNVRPSYFILSSLHHVKFVDLEPSTSTFTSMASIQNFLANRSYKESIWSEETKHLPLLQSSTEHNASRSHTRNFKKVDSPLCNHSIVMNDCDKAALARLCLHKQRIQWQDGCIVSSDTLTDVCLSTEKNLEAHKTNNENQKFTKMPDLNYYQEDANFPAGSPMFQEKEWYASPEELSHGTYSCASDIYQLGVLFFELFVSFNSWEEHLKGMSDLRQRILPPQLLSKCPKEAAFCLWLLHPDPESRPKARDVLQSQLFIEVGESLAQRWQAAISIEEKKEEFKLLLDFLHQVQQQKEKQAYKLLQDISDLTSDLEEVKKRWFTLVESVSNRDKARLKSKAVETSRRQEDVHMRREKLMRNYQQLEKVYFLMRLKMERAKQDREKMVMRDGGSREKDRLGCFFRSLSKYVRYSRFEEKATLRFGEELPNTSNMVCSMSFDCDQEYFATAGASKCIKVFEYSSILDANVDIHHPTIEMTSRSKLSSVCWNTYIKSHIASSDYGGLVQLWDASTGQALMCYEEHKKRVWSVDYSQADPTRLASGSDDGCVKLWSINQEVSIATIKTNANICCVQFPPDSSHLLAFGSADSKIHCYDLRNMKFPWCSMINHNKAISYVKFLDGITLVSSSTDNTLKLWDLSRVSSMGTVCNDSILTYTGHTNEKNFVGLSVMDGYIACGSETNSVFVYHRSFPMPVASHEFDSDNCVSGEELKDGMAHFVSSVCWRGNSQTLLTANSFSNIKVLEMV